MERTLASSHHRTSKVSLDVGLGTSCPASPLDHSTWTKFSGPHTGLGPQGRGCPCSSPTVFSPTFLLYPIWMAALRGSSSICLGWTSMWSPLKSASKTMQLLPACLRLPLLWPLLTSWRRTRMFWCDQISVGIWPSHTWDNYFFHALLFGLNVAPFIFTQVLAWPLQCLRARGISLLAYLDDIVVWHCDPGTLLAQMQQVMFPAGHGVQAEPRKVSSIPIRVDGLARYPLAPPVGALASSSKRPEQHSPHGPRVASGSHDHPPPPRTAGGSHKFCMPGAQIPFSLSHGAALLPEPRRETVRQCYPRRCKSHCGIGCIRTSGYTCLSFMYLCLTVLIGERQLKSGVHCWNRLRWALECGFLPNANSTSMY